MVDSNAASGGTETIFLKIARDRAARVLDPYSNTIVALVQELGRSRTWQLARTLQALKRRVTADPLLPLLDAAKTLSRVKSGEPGLGETLAAVHSFQARIDELWVSKTFRVARWASLAYNVLRLRAVPMGVLEELTVISQMLHREFTDDFLLPSNWMENITPRPLAFAKHFSPTASIIIPVHNNALLTFLCLETILSHTGMSTYEVILVDDASTDNTQELLSTVSGITLIRNETNLGFLLSCQHAVESAMGEFLVFLNNDVIVSPGWLDYLISTLKSYPSAGLVGAKLLNADGTLQEAGGIVWQDGSAWNYGRGSDPDRPEFNYLREVDYCSGACIALPKRVFVEVGGFDKRYTPAYYEDTDLAFSVRRLGYKVLYQPKATIIHLEGMTGGRDISTGPKQSQMINQVKFREKWKGVLKSHRRNAELPDLERDRYVNGRILVIDHTVPTPDRDSGSMRMMQLLRLLVESGYKVTFIPDNLHRALPYSMTLEDLGIEVITYPYFNSVRDFLERCARDSFDFVWVARVTVASKHIFALRRVFPHAMLVFDTVDLHFVRLRREAELRHDADLERKSKKMEQAELALAKTADVVIVVSPAERDVLIASAVSSHIAVIPNIHVPIGPVPSLNGRSDIVFIGGFHHSPNIDAVSHFVADIFPKICARLQDARFVIIGDEPPSEVRALASERIVVTGYVPEVSGYFERARVSVAPLRFGAGVKGKINLSMSYGVPVVASPLATEGMHLQNEVDVLEAADDDHFAESVVRLFNDDALWLGISQAGLENLVRYFSPAAARDTIQSILTSKIRSDTHFTSDTTLS